MPVYSHEPTSPATGAGDVLSPAEIVMGLHWPPHERRAGSGEPANLDARCLLLDREGRVLETVHPGWPANSNGSVLHTGDSRSGASEWDDERIFVFLDALPAPVSAVTFVVACASGRPLGAIPGAFCHVSDRLTEQPLIRVELARLGAAREHRIATLLRGPKGWPLFPESRSTS